MISSPLTKNVSSIFEATKERVSRERPPESTSNNFFHGSETVHKVIRGCGDKLVHDVFKVVFNRLKS